MENGIPIVGLVGGDDPFSPLNKSKFRKWLIIFIISMSSFCVTCTSSEVAETYAGIEAEFGVSTEVVTLGLSLFVMGMGSAPLVLGPLSEFYGRRPIYLVSYFFFVAFNIQVAVSQNIQTFLIGRFLGGCAGAAFLSVAGGSVSDLFLPHEVSAPMGVYTASPFLGPIFGPVIGGFINQHVNWRWTWYVTIIWSTATLVALVVLVPETFTPALLVQKAKRLRKEGRTEVKAPLEIDERSIPKVILISCARPFQILALEPMALMLCIWTSLLLGLLYMFFSAFAIVYTAYGFDLQEVGLSFLGLGIGIIFGTAAFPFWQKYYLRVARETGKRPPPEEHLRRGMAAAVIIPVCLFWFAFTTYTSIHWSVSMVSTVGFGIGVVWAFQSVFVYLVDAFRPVAASAMAANSFMRSAFAAGFPLFTRQMFAKLGTQWALALCAFLMLVMTPFPFLFFFYGARYRKGSRFSNTS